MTLIKQHKGSTDFSLIKTRWMPTPHITVELPLTIHFIIPESTGTRLQVLELELLGINVECRMVM